jgi:hypothetical protein
MATALPLSYLKLSSQRWIRTTDQLLDIYSLLKRTLKHLKLSGWIRTIGMSLNPSFLALNREGGLI